MILNCRLWTTKSIVWILWISTLVVMGVSNLLLDAHAQYSINNAGKSSIIVSATNQKQNDNDAYIKKELARIPGMPAVEMNNEQYPAWIDQPINGLHPIKRMLQPIIHLEKNSSDLQKQILRLEGPIAGLQPPMLGLHKRMTSVESKMTDMQGELTSMQSDVSGVARQMTTIDQQMKGIRADLADMHTQINGIEQPIKQLKDPISGVAYPLGQVRVELGQMKALLATVLLAIMIAAIAVSLGTPIAAILIYKHRRHIFPDMRDRDFPVARAPVARDLR